MFELAVSIASIILIVAIYLHSSRRIKETQDKILEIVPSLDDFVWQEDGEWKIDERIGKAFDYIGSRLAHSLQQAMFQRIGVDAKLQKNVDRALSADLLDNSGIGGLLDLFGMGHTKTILKNNPKTLGLILQRVEPLLAKYMQGQGKGFMNTASGSVMP